MRTSWKIAIRSILFICTLSLIAGAIITSQQHANYFSATWRAFLVVTKVSVFLCLLYVPLIWLIRTWWRKKYNSRSRKTQSARAFNKFIANNGALFGTVTICYALVLFIAGHLIAADATPDANDQINELAFKKPGFAITILQQPLSLQYQKTNFLKWMISGRPNPYNQIPLNQYTFHADSLYIERYMGDSIKGQSLAFAMHEITGLQNAPEENKKLIESEFIVHRKFILGTDDLGRDYLSRIIMGVRVSLSIGFVAVIIALFIGIPVGAFAGFYKKHPPSISVTKKSAMKIPLDDMIMWLINVIWAIPTLLLVFPIVFAFGQNYYTIFIAVGLTMWVDIARIVRGQVMQVRELEYIQATKSFGYSDIRTIFIHILPNITGPIIVITAANFAYAILTEAGLSFLGIGVQPPAPSWGLMISKYKDNLVTEPYLTLLPGLAITALVLAFFMIGNGVRDALDVKMKVSE